MNEETIRRKITAHAQSFPSVEAAWRRYAGSGQSIGEKEVERFLRDAGVLPSLFSGMILGRVMASLDGNGDGRVTQSELRRGLRR